MKKLVEVIKLEGKSYTSLVSAEDKAVVDSIAEKLEPLADEICIHPNASIGFYKTGALMLSLMPDELKEKIKQTILL